MVSSRTEELHVHLNGQVFKTFSNKLRSVVGPEILWNATRKDPVFQEGVYYGSCGNRAHRNRAR